MTTLLRIRKCLFMTTKSPPPGSAASLFPGRARRADIPLGRRPGGREDVEFFTDDDERLFGCTHLPQKRIIGGLIICSPLHAEFLHNYRKEVALARSLAAEGIVVQRFHYRGTGNSDGDAEALSLESMLQDASAAAGLLRRKTGIEHPAFLGTRLGALVAAAARGDSDAPLILWEPILDPAHYFADIFRVASVRELRAGARRSGRHASSGRVSIETLEKNGSVDVLGYSIHRTLFRSLLGHELLNLLGGRTCHVLLTQLGHQTEMTPQYAKFVRDARSKGFSVEAHAVRADEHWWFSGNPDHSVPTLKAVAGVTTRWLKSRFER